MFLRTESFKDFMYFYPVTFVLIVIQISIWLISNMIDPIGNIIYNYGVGNHYLIQQGEYWRLFTSIFLHAGIGHIVFNSFSLILFAPALEQMLGKFKFLFAYFFTGVAANILSLFANAESMNYYLGASGAIYGLFGLYMFMVLFEKKLIDPQSAKVITVIIVIGIIMTFIRPGIDITGHLFGFIAGIALGPIILKNVKAYSPYRNRRRKSTDDSIGFDPNRWNKKRYKYKKYVKPIITTIFIILVLLGVMATLLQR